MERGGGFCRLGVFRACARPAAASATCHPGRISTDATIVFVMGPISLAERLAVAHK